MKINYKEILLKNLGDGKNFLYHTFKRELINKIAIISHLLKCKFEVSEDTWKLLERDYFAMTFTGKFIKRSGKSYDFSLYVNDYVCHATGYLDINGIRVINFTKNTTPWDPGLYSFDYHVKISDEINDIFYKRKS